MLKKWIKKLMCQVDKATIKKNKFKTIKNTKTESVYMHMQTYKGADKQLYDGTVIKAGDQIAEMHLNNIVMSQMGSLGLSESVKLFAEEIYLVARETEADHLELKAIYGRSQLYAILKRIGFEIHEIDSSLLRLFLSYWDSIYRWAFSGGKNNGFKRHKAKEVWMSRKAILAKLGDKPYET